jgi:uncharacterized protein (TIGR04222 family)
MLTKRGIRATGELPKNASPLEQLVYAKTSAVGGTKWAVVQKAGSDLLAPDIERLRAEGFLITKRVASRIRVISTLPLWGALLVGGLKIAIGIQRNRPVEFLAIGCALLLGLALMLLVERPWRTHLGDERLETLRARHGDLKQEWNRPQTDARFALALALFGAVVLPEAMAEMNRRFEVIDAGASFGGSCGSGCGGGGGGSGCGGCGGGGH